MENMISDIRLSLRASEIAERFVTDGWFPARSDAAIFAAAFIIKNEFNSFDPGTYVPADAKGSNYAYGTFDKDGKWQIFIANLYDTDFPRQYFRNLMIYGLEKIGTIIDESNNELNIDDLF